MNIQNIILHLVPRLLYFHVRFWPQKYVCERSKNYARLAVPFRLIVSSFISKERDQPISLGRPPINKICVIRLLLEETGLKPANSLPDGCKHLIRYGFETLALKIKFSIGLGCVESIVISRTVTSERSATLFSPLIRSTLMPLSSHNCKLTFQGVFQRYRFDLTLEIGYYNYKIEIPGFRWFEV